MEPTAEEKEDEEPKGDRPEDNIDPVMLSYMAKLKEQKEKEKQVRIQLPLLLLKAFECCESCLKSNLGLEYFQEITILHGSWCGTHLTTR